MPFSKLLQNIKELSASQQNIGQATGFSFCKKMKTKLHKLKRMGKLSLSRGNRRGQNVLDLRKGSFSAGCRKASGMSAIVKIVLQLC